MTCGHLTTPEARIMDECFRPFRTAVRCDTCEEWVELAPKPKAAPLPEVPLF